MKRLISLLLSVVLILSLAACGPGIEGEPPVPSETKPQTQMPTQKPTTTEPTEGTTEPTESTEPEEYKPSYPIAIPEIWFNGKIFNIPTMTIQDMADLGYTTKGTPTTLNISAVKCLNALCDYTDSNGQTIYVQEEQKVVAFGVDQDSSDQFVFLLGLHVGMTKSDAISKLSSFGINSNSTSVLLRDDKYSIYIIFDGEGNKSKINNIVVYETTAAKDASSLPEADRHESDLQYQEQFNNFEHKWPNANATEGSEEFAKSLHKLQLNQIDIDVINDKPGKIYSQSLFKELQGIGIFEIKDIVSTCARTFMKDQDADLIQLVNDPMTGEILMLSVSLKDGEEVTVTNTAVFCGGIQVGMTIDQAKEANVQNNKILPIEFENGANLVKSEKATLIVEVKDGLIERITLINNVVYQ